MNYLLPPVGKENWVTVKLPGHEQVEKSGDGLFHVEDTHYAGELISKLGLRKATNEMFAKTVNDEDDDDDLDEDVTKWNKGDLKAWLDDKEIEYERGAKKDELLELVQEHMDDDEETEDGD